GGGDRLEIGSWIGEGDLYRLVVDYLDAVLALRGVELRLRRLLRVHVVPRLAPDDDVAGERVLALDGRVAQAREAVGEVLRSHRLAVRVLHVTERERVLEAVGRDVGVLRRRARDRLEGLRVEPHEALEDHHRL